jgi:hypothetical protein
MSDWPGTRHAESPCLGCSRSLGYCREEQATFQPANYLTFQPASQPASQPTNHTQHRQPPSSAQHTHLQFRSLNPTPDPKQPPSTLNIPSPKTWSVDLPFAHGHTRTVRLPAHWPICPVSPLSPPTFHSRGGAQNLPRPLPGEQTVRLCTRADEGNARFVLSNAPVSALGQWHEPFALRATAPRLSGAGCVLVR